MRKLVENNNYTMKIKGGSVIKFYGSEEALKWLSEVIADSGINQLKYVPENDTYARLKKANGKCTACTVRLTLRAMRSVTAVRCGTSSTYTRNIESQKAL